MNDDGERKLSGQRELRSQCRNLRFTRLKVFKIIEAHFAQRNEVAPERAFFCPYDPLEILLRGQVRMMRMNTGRPKSVRVRLRDLLGFSVAIRLKADVDKIHPVFPCAPNDIFPVAIKLGNMEVGVGIDEHGFMI